MLLLQLIQLVFVVCLAGVFLFSAAAIFLSQRSSFGEMDSDWAHYLAWAACTSSFVTACILVVHYAMNRTVYDDY